MQVQEVECQLAQAQMSRYLAGDPIPDEALRQLERHVASCSDCKVMVTERRQTLRAMLKIETGPDPTDSEQTPHARLNAPIDPIDVPAAFAGPVASSDAKHGFIDVLKTLPIQNWKPLAISGGLAIVLVAISFLMGNPSKILGAKAAKGAKSPPAPVTAKARLDSPQKNPAQVAPQAHALAKILAKASQSPLKTKGVKATLKALVPAKTPPRSGFAPKAKAAARWSIEKRQRPIRKKHRLTLRARKEPRRGTGSIKVYDPSGQPIHH